MAAGCALMAPLGGYAAERWGGVIRPIPGPGRQRPDSLVDGLTVSGHLRIQFHRPICGAGVVSFAAKFLFPI